jgi:DNA-binding response OmpR family regulator
MALDLTVDIVVIEDDRPLRHLLASELTEAGYSVSTTASAADLLAALTTDNAGIGASPSKLHPHRSGPRLILLDGHTPGADGDAFLRTYRARFDHACPIVVISFGAYPDEIEAERAADAALRKPFDLDELLALVDRFLPR